MAWLKETAFGPGDDDKVRRLAARYGATLVLWGWWLGGPWWFLPLLWLPIAVWVPAFFASVLVVTLVQLGWVLFGGGAEVLVSDDGKTYKVAPFRRLRLQPDRQDALLVLHAVPANAARSH